MTQLNLDNLTIINLIASGTFGKVYLVKDAKGQVYAMKKLNKAKIIMMRQVGHLKQEIQIMRQVKNGFIAKFYNAF